MKLKHKKRWAN